MVVGSLEELSGMLASNGAAGVGASGGARLGSSGDLEMRAEVMFGEEEPLSRLAGSSGGDGSVVEWSHCMFVTDVRPAMSPAPRSPASHEDCVSRWEMARERRVGA